MQLNIVIDSMKVYLDTNYPKNLAEALQLIHELQRPAKYEIIRTQQFDEIESVVFLFDRSKRGLDIVTEKHYKAGYKVIAFKLASTESIDLFKLSISTLKLWPTILNIITGANKPFILTYSYKGSSLKKVVGW